MASPPSRVTASAPLDAAQQALEHTRRHLFPFQFERWVTLGFVAFLDQCGRSGPMGNVPSAPGGGGGGGRGGDLEPVLDWLGAHVLLVSAVAAAVLVALVVLTALVLWVNSRGVFMYLDDVATGRFDVVRPWREHAGQASSYFAWSFALAMATLVVVLLLVLGGAAAVVVVVRARTPAVTGAAVAVMVGLFLLLLAFALCAALASLALRDFAAPLQLEAGRSCTDALRVLLSLVRAHPGVFVVYALLKMCFAMVVGLAALVVGCCTCCCGFLPVVAQTVLQPAYYFDRAWPVYVLRLLGHDVFPAAPAALPGSV